MRRRGLAILLAGCLRATTTSCPSGAECPSGYACITPAPYCAPEREVAACAGVPEFHACMTDAPGVCVQDVCAPCSADLAGCATNGWEAMTSGVGVDLQGIWVNSSSDAHAVGKNATVLDYDGHAWSPDPGLAMLSTGAASDNLSRVWGDPDGTLFVLGASTIYQRDPNHRWSISYGPAAPTFATGAIWGNNSRDVVAAGNPAMLFSFDGSGWTTCACEPTWPTMTQGLHGVWRAGAKVFVAGSNGLLARYDGTTWDPIMQPPGMSGTWQDIWGSAGDNVFAVANASTMTNIGFYNGSWGLETVSAPAINLTSVAGFSGTDVFAVGTWVSAPTPGVILKRQGTTWQIDAGTGLPVLTRIASVPGITGKGDSFVVGANGTILRNVGR